ncbi:MAG: hypothetical protein KAS32_13935 [Candidatus Peribacteraceae bacterium]|nr:hypothetical protein [Candidatus Peribacteraceae bacterium]
MAQRISKRQAKKQVFDKFKIMIDVYKKQEKEFRENGMLDLAITMEAHRKMVEFRVANLKQFFIGYDKKGGSNK